MVKDSTYEDQLSKTKIFLLAGFLGSGKTTLLKRILSWETDLSGTVVLVNEFGKVGIDGSLLKDAGSDVVELTSGCICCTLKLELFQTLKSIWDRFHPQRILLEATGVAEPGAVASLMDHGELKSKMEIAKVITVLDIRFWVARENFGHFFMNQVTQADLVLLNKIDTVENDEVSQALNEMQNAVPEIRVAPTRYCEIDPDILWEKDESKIQTTVLADYYQKTIHSAAAHHHEDLNSHTPERHLHPDEETGYIAFDFVEDRPMDEVCLKKLLDQAPWQLFRIKGPVRFYDRTVLLNYVAGTSRWETWPGAPGTRLAFVGWKLDAEAIIDKLKACLQK